MTRRAKRPATRCLGTSKGGLQCNRRIKADLCKAHDKPLPEHNATPHESGYWMVTTCERCRRQSIGQRRMLGVLLPDWKFDRFYGKESQSA